MTAETPHGEADCIDLLLPEDDQRRDRPALFDDYESVTYGKLREQAGSFASGLLELGVAPGDRVAIWMEDPVAFLTAALGCIWAGNAFVPLSVSDPEARLGKIVRDCDPSVIVTGTREAAVPSGSDPGRRIVGLPAVLAAAGRAPQRCRDPQRDVYVMYTSGTTGTPKGVRIQARALALSVAAIRESIGLDSSSRSLVVSPLYGDGSYGTLFPTLAAGGSVALPKRDAMTLIRRFFRAVLEDGITHTGLTPSHLRLILSSPRVASLRDSSLLTVGMGGEECSARDLARLWELLPHLRIFNRYGPTEATLQVTTHEVAPSTRPGGSVPIGAPHPGTRFHLIGEDRRIVDGPDQIGELCISGHQLMRGYWGDEELTGRVLRDDLVPGELVYVTGDLAYRNRDGLYVYVGRSNDVVKRSGERISLGEITESLRAVDSVVGALCVPVDEDGRLAIAAFVEAPPPLTAQDVRSRLATQLPPSMLPDHVFMVPLIPLGRTGKADPRPLLESRGLRVWTGAKEEAVATVERQQRT